MNEAGPPAPPAGSAPPAALEAGRLRRRCDPAALGFASTEELPDPPLLFAQERAVAALGFALAMRQPGYNVFVYGPPGSGRHTLVGDILRRQAAAEPDQPEVHLRPNKLVAYKNVAAVMAAAQRLGVTKLGIIGNEQFIK